ncbi:MAG: hypothetical protein ACWA42_03430 [Lutibacter sp.]
MIRKVTFLMLIAFVLFSCQTDEIIAPQASKDFNFTVESHDFSNMSNRDSETACYSTALIAGQNYEAGRIDVEIVNEDGTNYVYITYITNPDWVIKLTHLYAGVKEGIPETKKGNPKPGVFEKKMDYEANVISDFEVEYKIPADAFEECFYIAAHAEVAKIDDKGNEIQRETAWGSGEQFEGNSWAMYFEFCKSACTPTDDTRTPDDSSQR